MGETKAQALAKIYAQNNVIDREYNTILNTLASQAKAGYNYFISSYGGTVYDLIANRNIGPTIIKKLKADGFKVTQPIFKREIKISF